MERSEMRGHIPGFPPAIAGVHPGYDLVEMPQEIV